MPLDPQIAVYLDELAAAGLPPVHEISPHDAREQMEVGSRFLGPPEPVFSVENLQIPGPAGTIPIRCYRPTQAESLPVVLYFHGGGWVMGSIQTHDNYCRSLANASGVLVVSVEYRLAPESQYPAAMEDAYSATRWVAEHAAEIGADPRRLAVAGDSAGGNLAAAVALAARDRGAPNLALQVLIYPITDCRFDTDSYRQNADGYMLTRSAMRWFWEQYVGQEAQRSQPYVAPLQAENLTGLPTALVITAEFDPLRDEAEAYAERLRGAGVPVVCTRYEGMIHGFVRRLGVVDRAQAALDQVAATLQQSLVG